MFKDLMNVVAGEMLYMHGFTTVMLEQQVQFMICMIGSNPFFG